MFFFKSKNFQYPIVKSEYDVIKLLFIIGVYWGVSKIIVNLDEYFYLNNFWGIKRNFIFSFFILCVLSLFLNFIFLPFICKPTGLTYGIKAIVFFWSFTSSFNNKMMYHFLLEYGILFIIWRFICSIFIRFFGWGRVFHFIGRIYEVITFIILIIIIVEIMRTARDERS